MEDDNYDDSNDEREEDENDIIDDSDGDEEEEDALLNHGVDNSAKEKDKEEEKNEEEESDSEEVIIDYEKKEKPVFVSGVTKIHFNEYSRLLSKLATAISNNNVIVPEKYESLLNCESGNAITIAENWIKHRHKVPLPQELYRSFHGYIPERLNLLELKTMDELCFQDLDEEGNSFETCFRKTGYHTDYSKRK